MFTTNHFSRNHVLIRNFKRFQRYFPCGRINLSSIRPPPLLEFAVWWFHSLLRRIMEIKGSEDINFVSYYLFQKYLNLLMIWRRTECTHFHFTMIIHILILWIGGDLLGVIIKQFFLCTVYTDFWIIFFDLSGLVFSHCSNYILPYNIFFRMYEE